MFYEPLVSVIILNFDGEEHLETCLSSVVHSNYGNYEVILVDNASTDGSVEFVKQRFGDSPRLKVIRNEKNFGFALGNNIGVQRAKGEYIVFLNNDTEVDSNWIREIIKVMEADNNIGAAQSKLLLIKDRKRYDSAGDYMEYIFLCSGKAKFGELDNGQYDKVDEIFSAKGAALMVRRKVLDEVGLFDPRFFISKEDIDLCWRIWLRGYRIVFVPRSLVYHMRGATRKKTAPNTTALFQFHSRKNHIACLIKNYETQNLMKSLPICLAVNFRHALRLLLFRRRCESMNGFLKAIAWIIINFNYLWKRRQKVQCLIRKVRDEEIMNKVMKKPQYLPLYLLPKSFVRKMGS